MHRDPSSNEVSALVRRRRWAVLTAVFAGLAVASVVSLVRPREFECRTRIEVSSPKGLLPSELAARVEAVRDDLLRADNLLAAAAASGAGNRTADQLEASTRVEVEAPRDGVCVLHVAHRSDEAETSRRTVEALVGGYRRGIYELPKVRQQETVDGLRAKIETARADAERAAAALDEHAARHADLLGPLDEQRRSVQQEIARTEEEVARLDREIRESEQSLAVEPQYTKREARRPDAAKSAALEQDLERLRERLTELKGKLYGDDHPDVVALRAEIADVDRKKAELVAAAPPEVLLEENPVYAEHARLRTQAVAGARAARQRLQNLNRTDRDLQDRLTQLPPVRARRDELAAQKQAAIASRESLETELAAAEDRLRTVEDERQLDFLVTETPQTPRSPAGTPPALLALGGLALGAAAGVGAAWVADTRDRSFREADAVAAFVGLPALGAIGEIETPDEAAERRRQTRRSASRVAALALAATALAGWAVWDALPTAAPADAQVQTR